LDFEKPGKLTNMQLELLKLFNLHLNETQLLEIKDILTRYFAEKVTTDIDRVLEDKGEVDSVLQQLANEHMRTAYY
jgi:hypothetical protein